MVAPWTKKNVKRKLEKIPRNLKRRVLNGF